MNIEVSKNRREAIIRDAKPWKAIFAICIPTIILVTIQAIYNVIDKYLALQFASADVAITYHDALQHWIAFSGRPDMTLTQAAGEFINLATQYSGNVFNLLWSFAVLAAIGSSIVFSIQFGSRDKQKMEQAIGNGAMVSFGFSIIMMFITLMLVLPAFNSPILNMQANIGGRPSDVVQALNTLSYHYSLFLCIFTPINYLGFFLMSLLRSEGRMMFIIVVSVVSLLLNAVFAYVFMSILHLELYGAMLATVVAWFTNFLACLVLILFSKSTHIKFTRHGFVVSWKMIRQIILLGLSGLIVNLSAVVVSMLETNLTGALKGSAQFPNQNGILQTLFSAISPWMFLALAPAFGIFQGSSALVGYAYGANQYKRCKQLIIRITIMLFVWFLFDYIMFASVGKYMIQLFDDYYPHHNLLLFLNFETYPFTVINYASLVCLQSLNKAKISMIITLFRTLFIPVPVIFIAYAVSVAVANPIVFFAIYGLCDLISGLIILVIDYYALRHYRHKMVNIDLTQDVANFQTLPEIDLQVKRNRLTNRLAKAQLMAKPTATIEENIRRIEGQLTAIHQQKLAFKARIEKQQVPLQTQSS